jgi:hypothetical protein
LDRSPTSGKDLHGTHRSPSCSRRSERQRLALKVNVASLILVTEYDPAWYHRLNVKTSSRGWQHEEVRA